MMKTLCICVTIFMSALMLTTTTATIKINHVHEFGDGYNCGRALRVDVTHRE